MKTSKQIRGIAPGAEGAMDNIDNKFKSEMMRRKDEAVKSAAINGISSLEEFKKSL